MWKINKVNVRLGSAR